MQPIDQKRRTAVLVRQTQDILSAFRVGLDRVRKANIRRLKKSSHVDDAAGMKAIRQQIKKV